MPTYTGQHLLFRILGVFGSSAIGASEEWGVSLRITLPGGALSEADKADFLAPLEAPVKTFHQHAEVDAHSFAWLTELTAAYIGTDGKYVGGDTQPTTHHVLAAPAQGNGSTPMPFSNARVYTLRSTVERGRGSKGRFYYPCAEGIGTGGTWSTPTCQAAATAAKTMLDAINASANAQWGASSNIAVMSGLGAGTTGRVVRVEVGNLPDTQRRRDAQITEVYAGADLVGATLLAQDRLARVYHPR